MLDGCKTSCYLKFLRHSMYFARSLLVEVDYYLLFVGR